MNKTTLNKAQRRDIATLHRTIHFGANHAARVLSVLHRSAPKKSQQAEIMDLAMRLNVDSNPEFIISDTFTTI